VASTGYLLVCHHDGRAPIRVKYLKITGQPASIGNAVIPMPRLLQSLSNLAFLFLVLSKEQYHEHSISNNASSISILRPSESDFVEVIRGGDLATDVVIRIQGFKVPESGYLTVQIADRPVIMCPRISENISECPNGDENLPETVRLTFFNIELGPQEICLELWDWSQLRQAEGCSHLVGSESFMGRRESREYFNANILEFVGESTMALFWRTFKSKSTQMMTCSVLSALMWSTYSL
jgi:hypothetical protein